MKKRVRTLWSRLLAKIFWYLCKEGSERLFNLYCKSQSHNAVLRNRLNKARQEKIALEHKQKDYEKLRVMTKATLSHGEHVKYVDKHTVKIKLDRKFHDSIIECIERIEKNG